MAGLMVEEGDVSGAIAAFITENGYYATVLTQYDDHPIYIQRLMCRLNLKDSKIVVREVDTEVAIATIDLSHPDSLDQIIGVLKQWETFRKKNPLLSRY